MCKPLIRWSIVGLVFITSKVYAAANAIQGHIGALSNQASQSVGNVPGNRANADLFFDYHKNTSTSYTKGVDQRFTFASLVNDQNLTMYSVQEAYLGFDLSLKDHLKIGRQILSWSTVDSAWGFGKVNNRRNFDYFNPGQEGLLGLGYEHKFNNGIRIRAFGSGLYVPELNPSFDINNSNGTITSRSQWSDVPASSTNVEGVDMAIKYKVNMPRNSDVIYRYSGGLNIGHESKHWVMDNFFMRKPENQITPDVDVNISFVNKLVTATIDPAFYYHDVYGSTLKYRNREIEMYVSGIAIRPNTFPDVNENVRYTEIKNRKRREDYMGVGISKSNDLYTLGFNYVARLSPFDRKNDDLSQDPRWNQAINVVMLRNFGRHYSLSTDMKYDMLTTDRLVMVRGIYNATKNMQMNVGMNLIGTPNDGKSYWSPYTNNDAIYGGLRYVF